MRASAQTTSLSILVLSTIALLTAEQPGNPSAHWVGTVSTPRGEIRFAVDVWKNSDGMYAGALDLPDEQISGLPLRHVAVDGVTVDFDARTDQSFHGELAADGQSISGTYSVEGMTLPFSIVRSGDAHIRTTAKGSALPKVFEGDWTGTIASNGSRVVLMLANDSDGRSSAVLINQDEGDLRIPGVAEHNGASLSVELGVISGSYRATLSEDGTELSGTYTQKGRSIPLTFRRDTTRDH